jgi:sugar-specific transcriptional regulator TrmB
MTDEKLVEKLLAFNLTPNQARIYAYLSEASQAHTNKIADATNIHHQDIYKALRALQKKGLVFKSVGKPIVWEAVPFREGLSHIVNSLDKEFKQKIKILIEYQREISEWPKQRQQQQRVHSIIPFLKTPVSRIDLTFENLKEKYDRVLSDGPYWGPYPTWNFEYEKTAFKKAADRNVVFRHLVLTKKNSSSFVDYIKLTMPKNAKFEIRLLNSGEEPFFVLIDSRELWLIVKSTGNVNTIITDAPEIVTLAKAQFDNLWNSPNAIVAATGPQV